jgi:phage shock protein PspC (stress-responsive transcriptional regulator)
MTENAAGATRCAACTSWIGDHPVREWTRARGGRVIGGVARGLANRFGLPIAPVRLAFLLGLVFGGWGLLAYLALWIVMPEEPLALPAATAPLAPPQPQMGEVR